MSICLVALVVLAVLGIFSAKYRSWAREAFDCVSRRLTLRACRTGFNDKVRARITGTLMKRNMGVARFTHRHFEVISWVFTVVMFLSLAYTAYGFYNLSVYGTCDPVTGNCIFNPGGDPNKVICPFEGIDTSEGVTTIGGFQKIDSVHVTGRPVVYFLGTTWCPHCSWERPVFEKATAKFGDLIDVRKVEIDISYTEEDTEVFNHFSPEGSIPVVIIGGKYYRIGAGEHLGEQGEEQVLTALLCSITESPIQECSEPAIQQMMESI